MARLRAEGRAEFVRLEPGKKYHWKVEEAEDCYSGAGDNQIKLAVKVGDANGQLKIHEYLTFSLKAYYRIELFLKSAGKYPGDGVEVDFAARDCVGLRGACTVRDEKSESNGKTYSRIDRWLEASTQTPPEEWITRARAEPAMSNQGSLDDDRFDPDYVPF